MCCVLGYVYGVVVGCFVWVWCLLGGLGVGGGGGGVGGEGGGGSGDECTRAGIRWMRRSSQFPKVLQTSLPPRPRELWLL